MSRWFLEDKMVTKAIEMDFVETVKSNDSYHNIWRQRICIQDGIVGGYESFSTAVRIRALLPHDFKLLNEI